VGRDHSHGTAVRKITRAPSLLPGRLDDSLLDRWEYQEEVSHSFTQRDRSAIYGGFHLYVLKTIR
jgi:S-adenosylmethionine-diacylglycerol 3-amino-3-carboxypropyl transferase